MKNVHRLSAALLISSSLLTFNASAEIYTWTDGSGKVHYSDKPVHTENVSTIIPTENNNISKPVASHNQWQQDYYETKQANAEKTQKTKKQAQRKQDYCAQLKSRLAIYNEGGRIYVMSPEGERSYQSEAQLSAKKKSVTKLIKKNCR